MLRSLSLKNFKSFETLEELEFKPITILCGVNSSGKSSILKSILLLKQTMESQQVDTKLLFNGKMVKLGAFENIVHNHNTSNEMRFTLTYSFRDLANVLKRTRVKAMIKDFFNIDLNKNTDSKIKYSFAYKKFDDEIFLSELTLEGNNVFLNIKNTGNNKYILNCKNIFSAHRSNSRINIQNETVEVVQGNALIPNIIISLKEMETKNDFTNRRSIDMMLRYSNVILDYLLAGISYIGPLRKEPARRYIYEDEISSIGIWGENTAFIYAKEKNDTIKAYFYNEYKNQFDKAEYKFCTALNKWLKLMNIIDFDNNQRNEIIRLNVKSNSGVKVDISDVGFGVSQVLPILVEGLRIEEGETLLLEQPEIHLHPRLQMQLTDFFIAMALDNKNTIIETHSEHVINRLVRRSLEDGTISKLINIYFIDENSNIKLIQIDKSKGIVNWPKNFFDQAANEQREILKLALKNGKE